MKYLFRDEWHEVPQYAAYPACRLVAVRYSIPLARVEPRDQRRIERSWRKVAMFVAAEGISSTFHKVRSKQAQAHNTGDFHVVLAIGTALSEGDQRSSPNNPERSSDNDNVNASSGNNGGDDAARAPVLLCLGTRHPRCAEVMLFRDELTIPLPLAPAAELCLQAASEAARALNVAGDLWRSIAGYNFYSDLEPPDNAVEFLRIAAAALTSSLRQSRAAGLVSLTTVSPTPPAAAASAALSGAASFNTGSYVKPEDARPPVIHPLSAPGGGDDGGRRTSSPALQHGGACVVAAGDYARTVIIPALKRAGIKLHTVVDLEPYAAAQVKKQFGFAAVSTDWRDGLAKPETEIVIIASYHDSHALIAAEALRHGKKVFLEKPPAVTREDLALLLKAASCEKTFLEVGYNRRFAPFSRKAKELLRGVRGPISIVCLVKEVSIPDQHWYRWPKQGTRITGNICHWIDLSIYLINEEDTDNPPVEISVSGQADWQPDEERALTMLFRDGSTVIIAATSRGDSTLGVQELIEVRRADVTIRIDDFRSLTATQAGRTIYHARAVRNKGHRAMYDEALDRMKTDVPALYTLRELRLTTLLTISATQMIKSNLRQMSIDV